MTVPAPPLAVAAVSGVGVPLPPAVALPPLAVAVLGGVLSSSYVAAVRPALAGLSAAQATVARGSIAQAALLAGRLPKGGALLHAAGTAFLDGMGVVMVICMALTALAAVIALRFLPGRSRHSRAQQADLAA